MASTLNLIAKITILPLHIRTRFVHTVSSIYLGMKERRSKASFREEINEIYVHEKIAFTFPFVPLIMRPVLVTSLIA